MTDFCIDREEKILKVGKCLEINLYAQSGFVPLKRVPSSMEHHFASAHKQTSDVLE